MAESKDTIDVITNDGKHHKFTGRFAWALRELMNAGDTGVTPIDRPAPRWSHYVFKLREAGIAISTTSEPHKGAYPGTHGRYRLETKLNLCGGDAA